MSEQQTDQIEQHDAGRTWRRGRRALAAVAVVIVAVVWATTRTPDTAPTDDRTPVGIAPSAPAAAPTATPSPTVEPATDLPADDDQVDGQVPEPDPVAVAASEAASAAATAAVTAWWATDSAQTGMDRLVGLVTPDAEIADGPTVDDTGAWSTSGTVSYVVPLDGTDTQVTYSVQVAYTALVHDTDGRAIRLHGTADQRVTVAQQPDGSWFASAIDEPV